MGLPVPPETRAGPISASSAENVWIFGTTSGVSGWLPQARRWNGTTELSVPASSNPISSFVYGAVTTRPHDTWAVGTQQTAPFGPITTLIEHYTGGPSFTDLDSPNAAGAYNQLRAITVVPGSESDLWAVGQGGDGEPLILHHP